MTYSRFSRQYNKTDVETLSGIDLIILCHEKIIQFLKQAKELQLSNEIERKGEKIEKVLGIISELRSSLNYEKGGRIAENLDSIYSYLLKRIVEKNLNKTMDIYDEAIHMIGELKNAWEEINTPAESHRISIANQSGYENKISSQLVA